MSEAIRSERGSLPVSRVRTAALDILKDVGINIGAQLSRQMIFQISGEVLKRINRAVGFRLITKAAPGVW
jgi:hypothetical protein